MGVKTGSALSGAGKGAATGAAIGSVVPGIGTAAGALLGGLFGGVGGWFSGKGKEDKAKEDKRAKVAKANLTQKMTEDKRRAGVSAGQSLLKGLGARGGYGGKVDLSGMALDPQAYDELMKERTYNFEEAIPDEMAGAGASSMGEFFSGIPEMAGQLAGFMGGGGMPPIPGMGSMTPGSTAGSSSRPVYTGEELD